jgi:hypothetical protein
VVVVTLEVFSALAMSFVLQRTVEEIETGSLNTNLLIENRKKLR